MSLIVVDSKIKLLADFGTKVIVTAPPPNVLALTAFSASSLAVGEVDITFRASKALTSASVLVRGVEVATLGDLASTPSSGGVLYAATLSGLAPGLAAVVVNGVAGEASASVSGSVLVQGVTPPPGTDYAVTTPHEALALDGLAVGETIAVVGLGVAGADLILDVVSDASIPPSPLIGVPFSELEAVQPFTSTHPNGVFYSADLPGGGPVDFVSLSATVRPSALAYSVDLDAVNFYGSRWAGDDSDEIALDTATGQFRDRKGGIVNQAQSGGDIDWSYRRVTGSLRLVPRATPVTNPYKGDTELLFSARGLFGPNLGSTGRTILTKAEAAAAGVGYERANVNPYIAWFLKRAERIMLGSHEAYPGLAASWNAQRVLLHFDSDAPLQSGLSLDRRTYHGYGTVTAIPGTGISGSAGVVRSAWQVTYGVEYQLDEVAANAVEITVPDGEAWHQVYRNIPFVPSELLRPHSRLSLFRCGPTVHYGRSRALGTCYQRDIVLNGQSTAPQNVADFSGMTWTEGSLDSQKANGQDSPGHTGVALSVHSGRIVNSTQDGPGIVMEQHGVGLIDFTATGTLGGTDGRFIGHTNRRTGAYWNHSVYDGYGGGTAGRPDALPALGHETLAGKNWGATANTAGVYDEIIADCPANDLRSGSRGIVGWRGFDGLIPIEGATYWGASRDDHQIGHPLPDRLYRASRIVSTPNTVFTTISGDGGLLQVGIGPEADALVAASVAALGDERRAWSLVIDNSFTGRNGTYSNICRGMAFRRVLWVITKNGDSELGSLWHQGTVDFEFCFRNPGGFAAAGLIELQYAPDGNPNGVFGYGAPSASQVGPRVYHAKAVPGPDGVASETVRCRRPIRLGNRADWLDRNAPLHVVVDADIECSERQGLITFNNSGSQAEAQTYGGGNEALLDPVKVYFRGEVDLYASDNELPNLWLTWAVARFADNVIDGRTGNKASTSGAFVVPDATLTQDIVTDLMWAPLPDAGAPGCAAPSADPIADGRVTFDNAKVTGCVVVEAPGNAAGNYRGCVLRVTLSSDATGETINWTAKVRPEDDPAGLGGPEFQRVPTAVSPGTLVVATNGSLTLGDKVTNAAGDVCSFAIEATPGGWSLAGDVLTNEGSESAITIRATPQKPNGDPADASASVTFDVTPIIS